MNVPCETTQKGILPKFNIENLFRDNDINMDKENDLDSIIVLRKKTTSFCNLLMKFRNTDIKQRIHTQIKTKGKQFPYVTTEDLSPDIRNRNNLLIKRRRECITQGKKARIKYTDTAPFINFYLDGRLMDINFENITVDLQVEKS